MGNINLVLQYASNIMLPLYTIKILKERWEHSGFQKYFKNTSWAFFGKIFSLGISFLTTIYVIRHLGPNNYGLFIFSVGFVGLFAFIASLGIDNVLYRELAKDISKKDTLLGTSLFLKIIASTLAIVIIIISTYLLKTDSITRLLIIINSFTLFFGAFSVIWYFFQAQIQAKYQAISLIFVTLLLNFLKILVIFFDKGVIYFAIVFFLENIFYAIIAIFLYLKSGNSILSWKINKELAISILKDSWPLMLSSAFIIIYTRIDQVMLKFMSGNFDVGIYDAAARVSEVWYFIPSLIVSSIFPAIVNSKKVGSEFFEKRLVKLYSLVFYIAILVALPITFFSNSLIKILYGDNFIQASGVLSIYIWAGVPVFLSIVVNAYLLAENKTKISFLSSAVGMITNIALNLLLIPLYGIQGAATATLISYSLIPLSILFFKDTRSHLLVIKDGILYPFRWFALKI